MSTRGVSWERLPSELVVLQNLIQMSVDHVDCGTRTTDILNNLIDYVSAVMLRLSELSFKSWYYQQSVPDEKVFRSQNNMFTFNYFWKRTVAKISFGNINSWRSFVFTNVSWAKITCSSCSINLIALFLQDGRFPTFPIKLHGYQSHQLQPCLNNLSSYRLCRGTECDDIMNRAVFVSPKWLFLKYYFYVLLVSTQGVES